MTSQRNTGDGHAAKLTDQRSRIRFGEMQDDTEDSSILLLDVAPLNTFDSFFLNIRFAVPFVFKYNNILKEYILPLHRALDWARLSPGRLVHTF